ncbi:MAG TPA: hypothetical protein VGN69_10970 [Solirubrobacteraceae bacterium]|jgi:hypothetical protein|nr:hypothetical protein [Solirubrobacteraceae bacterium]
MTAGGAGKPADYHRPIYFSGSSDPVFTLHCTEAWGVCPLEGLQVRVPDAARPAGGTDAHLTVIDQVSGWEYDMWQVASKPVGGGTLNFSWGGKTRVDGDGLGSGATAAEYGTAAGNLRAEELASGQINHALMISVPCDSGSYVYPATKGGQSCASVGQSNTNAPPEGTRFQLTLSDTQITALNVPDWKKTLLRAMAHYGMIVGDTGSRMGIIHESSLVYTAFGQADRWVSLAKQAGAPFWAPDDVYVFNIADGVDWAHSLRVVAPCASQGRC